MEHFFSVTSHHEKGKGFSTTAFYSISFLFWVFDSIRNYFYIFLSNLWIYCLRLVFKKRGMPTHSPGKNLHFALSYLTGNFSYVTARNPNDFLAKSSVLCLTFSLYKHIFQKCPISNACILDEYMRNGPNTFSILHDRAATHPLNNPSCRF